MIELEFSEAIDDVQCVYANANFKNNILTLRKNYDESTVEFGLKPYIKNVNSRISNQIIHIDKVQNLLKTM